MKQLLAFLPTLLLFARTGFSQEKDLTPALAALVEAERAFSKTCGEIGIRDSFLEFFADDCITFHPHPGNAKERLRQRPADAKPFPITLRWEPIFGDIAQAGDLGYSTGPFMLTDNTPQKRPPQHGFFFSIWKKQADSSWKVMLDVGIDTPPEAASLFGKPFQPAQPVSLNQSGTKMSAETERAALLKLERVFSQASAAQGASHAYRSFMHEEMRMHCNGIMPILGKEAILTFLSENVVAREWEPLASEVSLSGDLGYTYGSYTQQGAGASGAAMAKGYYVHVWKRNTNGEWKPVVEVISPLPPEEK